MDYVEISNSMIVYLLCGITVAIAFVQAVLYIRMAKKMTVKANIPATVPKTAFRVGLISAIGPALGVFIVMVGLMTSIGGRDFPSLVQHRQSLLQQRLVLKRQAQSLEELDLH